MAPSFHGAIVGKNGRSYSWTFPMRG